jgi:hypothetical protein
MALQSKTSESFFKEFVRRVIIARMNQLGLKMAQRKPAPMLPQPAPRPLPRPAPVAAPKPTLPAINLSPGTINWDRLKQMMADPSVQGVECQGPDKPLMLRKFGYR